MSGAVEWRPAWSDGALEWAGCALARGWWLVARSGGEDSLVVGPFDSRAEAEGRMGGAASAEGEQ